MLSKILTVVVLVSVFGCTKEFKKSDNVGVETATELNDGHHETVIEKLKDKPDLSPRERYYLGSAYSRKAGVDVYSLYSVLEIQLFHKKALDWTNLSTDKNPYLKFMKKQDGIDYEKRQKLREARWQDFLPDIRRKNNIHGIQTFAEITADPMCHCKTLTREEYDLTDEEFKRISKFVKEKNPTLKNYSRLWDKEPNPLKGKSREGNFYYFLMYQHQAELELELMRSEYLSPQDPKIVYGGMTWELIMNILWYTYESIPMIKKLPDLSLEKQEDITNALVVYLPLLGNKEFKEVGQMNIMVLAIVSMLDIYSSSFELDTVDSMPDLFCSFDPQVLIDNYGLIRKRIIALHKASLHMETDDKRLKTFKENLNELEQSSEEELSDAKKAELLESVRSFKLDQCFPT